MHLEHFLHGLVFFCVDIDVCNGVSETHSLLEESIFTQSPDLAFNKNELKSLICMAHNRCLHLFWSTIDQNAGRRGHMVSI